MKTKPNTEQFKKDPSALLQGGAVDSANQPELAVQSRVTKVHREQKVFRLPLDFINALKRESYERLLKTGFRVTETELVGQAFSAQCSWRPDDAPALCFSA